MSADDAWAHTPRQYRPHAYVPTMSQSTSLSSLDYGYGQGQKHSIHVHSTPTRQVAPYSRRGSDSTFPRPTPHHSTAAVVKSRLTASVSSNVISRPSQISQRHGPVEIHNIIPSRILTPVAKSPAQLRYASAPELPSQKRQKENIRPQTLRLLGPISPTCNVHPQIPKSRTMGMLSSLTSSFSRSNLNLSTSSSRQTSVSSARSTFSMSSTSPLPVFITNTRQIHTAQPNSYWSGRFQALNDRFHNELLENALQDSKIMRRYTDQSPPPQAIHLPTLEKSNGKTTKQERVTNFEEIEDTCSAFISEDQGKCIRRVFVHLEALCVTSEAKKSLWEWQLAYARQEQSEYLLPSGGKMTDDRTGWVSRMSRAIRGSGSSEASVGRRTGMTLRRRRDEQ